MNSYLKKSLKQSIIKKSRPIFLNFLIKTKFRRLTQPGLTRYFNNDENVGNENYERCLTHGSNAEILISAIPPVEIKDDVALCYGVQDFGWGHPVEFIQLNNRDITNPSICKYCGLRYIMKSHHDNIKNYL